jgi:hypothetical protein
MISLSELPLRQKVFLSLTILTGLFLLLAYYTSIISLTTLNLTIFFYSMGIPMLLLAQDTLVDLDNKNIFRIWATIGIVFMMIYFLAKGNPDLAIRKSPDFIDRGINKIIAKGSTTGFKALPLFLISYWILNSIVKKKTGKCIVNTFKQHTWYNDVAKRGIDWFDVFTNLILFAVILCATLLEI